MEATLTRTAEEDCYRCLKNASSDVHAVCIDREAHSVSCLLIRKNYTLAELQRMASQVVGLQSVEIFATPDKRVGLRFDFAPPAPKGKKCTSSTSTCQLLPLS